MSDESTEDEAATEAAGAGSSSRVSGDLGEAPRPVGSDDELGAVEMATPGPDEPAPGDATSVPVPSDDSTAGSSETFAPVDGVRLNRSNEE